jgi:sterol desaturase/sphingolipid hydroxylase (fatty acid hydroxylase superfamily)
MIGFPLALLYSNASEWLIHKYVLHGPDSKKPGGMWSFHFLEHHRHARLKEMRDPDYERSVFGMHAQGKEAAALLLGAVAHAPLFGVAPWFTMGVWYSIGNYYYKHKKAHEDPQWARENLPWHYDHHMGPNQHKNWCVTRPWFDHVMGTRVPYVGTELEKADRERRERSKARREAAKAIEGTTEPTGTDREAA